MQTIEQEILALIRKYLSPCTSTQQIYLILDRFQDLPLGCASIQFIHHPDFKSFISEVDDDTMDYFHLWLDIYEYLHHKNDKAVAHNKILEVEKTLQQCLRTMTPEHKACGMAMFPIDLANPKFVSNIYSSNDERLIALYLKYFPEPSIAVFQRQPVPKKILKKDRASTQKILEFLNRSGNNREPFAHIEKKVMTIQRLFRSKKRKEENKQRLPERYRDLWKNIPENSFDLPDPDGFTDQLIADANQPYQPKCDDVLAKRIIQAAKKVTLFSTVTHLTHQTALQSIFNDALYGRRSLIQRYMPFRPAALFPGDISEGDGDVICLGANLIDPFSRHGIALQFDVKKIAEKNPCVFFKQKDLGFDPNIIRKITIGDRCWYFSHTATYKHQREEMSAFILFTSDGKYKYAASSVKKATLISDNIEQMHEILTLNFFRFVDELMMLDYHERINDENIHDKQAIYSQLNRLNDEQLVETLEAIGRQITDTMEFNCYGAYKIEFSALISIKNELVPYTLHMANFIQELRTGYLELFEEAIIYLPELFNSYRFIDYLLSVTSNQTVIGVLQEQRNRCHVPTWMENSSLSP